MIKRKRNISIIILIILVIILAIILIVKITRNKIGEKGDNQVTSSSSILSNEEKQEVIDKIGQQIGNKTDKEVLIVNKEKISEREIALINFQINNKYVNDTENLKDAVDETIKEYIIVQDAKEKGIILSENESKNIENKVKGFIIKDDTETNSILNAFNMEYEEFLEFYINRTKRLELMSKWKIHIMNVIDNKETINVDSESFNKKYDEYKSNTDNTKKASLVFELIDMYEEYLKETATIEYIN